LFYTVYKITNNINGKYYIGKHQTKDLDDEYMGSGKLLKHAINKYGIENFNKEILHVFDNVEEMNAREAELVIVSEGTYNLCEGGQGGFGYINQSRSSENRRNSILLKMRQDKNYKETCSKSLIEFNKKPSNNAKIVRSKNMTLWNKNNKNPMSGKKHSTKTKNLMADKKIGKNNPSFGTCWITNGNEVKKIPLEALDSHLEMGYHKGRK